MANVPTDSNAAAASMQIIIIQYLHPFPANEWKKQGSVSCFFLLLQMLLYFLLFTGIYCVIFLFLDKYK